MKIEQIPHYKLPQLMLLPMLLSVGLSACDSSTKDKAPASQVQKDAPISEKSEAEPVAEAEPVDSHKSRSAIGGRWTGKFLEHEWADEFWGLIAEDGSAAFTTEYGGIFWGKLELDSDGEALSGKLKAYQEGEFVSHVELTGRVVPQKSIRGMYSVSKDGKTSDKAPFILQYESSYETKESLKSLVGDWVHRNSSLHIDEAGAINGKTRDGCVVSGKVSAPDERFSAFDLSLELKQCERAGSFDGLMGLDFEMSKNDTLNFVVASEDVAHTDHLHREGTKAAARVHEVKQKIEAGEVDPNSRDGL